MRQKTVGNLRIKKVTEEGIGRIETENFDSDSHNVTRSYGWEPVTALNPDQLRELAQAFNQIADELEKKQGSFTT
ncbi:MAG TPA: hypothetical protein ENI23_06290 [bacterium]|nr:hypothetical protein [bacterium]